MVTIKIAMPPRTAAMVASIGLVIEIGVQLIKLAGYPLDPTSVSLATIVSRLCLLPFFVAYFRKPRTRSSGNSFRRQ